MKIYVCIPVFNEINSIEKLFNQLANQNYKDEFKVVITDNNSTDGTFEKALELMTNYSKTDFVVIRETKAGVTNARQAGYTFVMKEISKLGLNTSDVLIISTDADGEIGPSFVKQYAEYMAPKTLMLSYGESVYPKVEGQNALEALKFLKKSHTIPASILMGTYMAFSADIMSYFVEQPLKILVKSPQGIQVLNDTIDDVILLYNISHEPELDMVELESIDRVDEVRKFTTSTSLYGGNTVKHIENDLTAEELKQFKTKTLLSTIVWQICLAIVSNGYHEVKLGKEGSKFKTYFRNHIKSLINYDQANLYLNCVYCVLKKEIDAYIKDFDGELYECLLEADKENLLCPADLKELLDVKDLNYIQKFSAALNYYLQGANVYYADSI